MAAFPSYAKILQSGRTEEADYGIVRSEMDGGLAKQRRRWTSPVVSRDVTVQVRTTEDRFAFDDWVRDDLGGGAGWFAWQDLDGTVRQARFVEGKVRWSRAGGGIWNAQAVMETVG